MKGPIFIGTILNNKQTPFIIVQCVMYPIRGLNDLFLGPKYHKMGPEKHPFSIPFQITPSCAVFKSHGLHWAPLW